MDTASELIPFSLFYKNKVNNFQKPQAIRKVKRFQQKPISGPKSAAGVSQPRFSPDTRPVPRTPNLVLDTVDTDGDTSVTTSHLELEVVNLMWEKLLF